MLEFDELLLSSPKYIVFTEEQVFEWLTQSAVLNSVFAAFVVLVKDGWSPLLVSEFG
jgi:hypothetical protein